MIKIIHDGKTCPNKEICKFRSEREMAIDFLKTAMWREGRFIDNVCGLDVTLTCTYLNKTQVR